MRLLTSSLAIIRRTVFSIRKTGALAVLIALAGSALSSATGYAAPANDNFANAATITLVNDSFSIGSSNVGATKEAGEPNHAGATGGTSVWWKVSATSTGAFVISTGTSSFDTVLGVYTGSSVSTLTTLASNDDQSLGNTTSTLTVNVTAGTTYYIAVDGKNAATGSINLSVSFIQPVAPVFGSTLPSFQNVSEGQQVSFFLSASGTPSPTPRWQRLAAGGNTWDDLADVGLFSGTHTNNLTISSVSLAMNGDQLRCVATNIMGTVYSNATTLVVNPAVAPSIPSMPSSILADTGGSFSINPTVTGSSPLTYQWKKDGVAIPGATNSSYSKSGVTTADSGSYTLTATNLAGNFTSSAAIVTVSAPTAPFIQSTPYSQSVAYGGSFNLNVSASGSQPLTYQWKINGVDIPNATSSFYSRSNLTVSDSAVYSVAVSNAVGTVSGTIASIVVNAATAPVITSMPASLTVDYGATLSIQSGTVGSPLLNYEWKKDGVTIAGSTSASFFKNSVTAADAGTYQFTATNNAGIATASTVVTVNPAVAPIIYNLPAGVTQDYASSLSLSASVIGTQPITFQWKKDGVDIPNATSSSYFKNSLVASDAGSYTLTATNVTGPTTSAPVVVTVGSPVGPQIAISNSQTIAYGNALSISPSVSGTQPMTFQWKKDGVDIPNATSMSYFKSPVTVADSGNYTLTATNLVGTITSSPQTVTVAAPIAPTITNVPATIPAAYGVSFQLNPTINGSSPRTYVWKKDGVVLSGDTSSSLFRGSPTQSDAGVYTLTVSNAAGTTVSSAMTVTVADPVAPAISNLPTTLTLAYGDSLNLSATVTGSPSFLYQWKKDGVDLLFNSNNFFKSSVTLSDAGVYTLSVTNSVGTTVSSPVTVVVSAAVAPTVAALPATATIAYNNSFSFNPAVTGSSPLTYQWKKDGVVVSTGSSSYFRSSVTPADNGVYTLTVTNIAGTVTSSGCTVTVSAPVAPAIFGLPASVTLQFGQSLNFNANVTGTQSISYQWKKDGFPIPGANSSSYSKSAVTQADSGSYVLVASNVAGVATSSPVTVTVNAAVLPVISGLPALFNCNSGDTLNFSPTYGGTQPMGFQWYKDGTEIPGANSANFSKSFVTAADSGTYAVAATNAAGTTVSSNIVVTVTTPVAPLISGLPATATFNYGDSLFLSPVVNGSTPRTYQWKKGGVNVPGATSQTLNFSATTADSGTYTLTVTNAAGTTVSSPVVVTVNPPVAPLIINLPAKLVLNYGDFLNLSPNVYGTPSITFQWQKDGANITSASTFSGYSKSSATPADSGAYTLTATNIAGTTVSAVVAVTVTAATPPTITQQPASTTVLAGTNVSFTVSASGIGTLAYQWFFNGVAMAGSTSSSLSLSNVQAAQVGSYTVSVTNPGGTIVSDAATLAIVPAQGVVSVDAGNSHTLFIKSDGSLWSTGSNFNGQLGNGTNVGRSFATQVATNVVRVAGGGLHTLLLKADGSLWAVGNNDYGQLGDATLTSRKLPVPIATGVIDIAAGYNHSVFLKADGSLWTMGDNSYGQLGGGAIGARYSPVQVATNVTAIAAGNYHTLFIKSDGSLWAAGNNGSGQLSYGLTGNQSTPVQVATGVVAVTAGGSHSLYIKSDGTLWATGYNNSGQLGDGSTANRYNAVQITTGVASVSAGDSHSVFVKTDGTLCSMGYNGYGQLGDGTTTNRSTPVSITTGVLAVSAGSNYSLALKTDGSLWGVGYNSDGELATGSFTNSSPWVQLAAGPVAAPATPTNVTATDGTLPNKVRISWNPSLGATSWEVWRNSSNDSNTATKIAGNLTAAIFYDSTAAGVPYFYWIRAVNPGGSSALSVPDSGYAQIPPPQITLQPVSKSVPPGQSATFTAAATGTPTLTYQWMKNGLAIPGATNASYTIAAVAASDVGVYTMVATNAGGSVSTNGAMLSLTPVLGATDFNGDGNSDLIWQNIFTGQTYVWLMNGTSLSSAVSVGTMTADWSIATMADFNGDGNLDVVWQNASTHKWRVWLMNGTSIASDVDMGSQPSGWSIVGSGDFNADGKADLVWRLGDIDYYTIWFMDGLQYVSGYSWAVGSADWSLSATGDFNADGKSDFVWTNTTTGERRLWLMNGTTLASDASLGIVDPSWTIVGTGVFNSDRKSDIVWSNTQTGERSVWLMNGTTVASASSVGTVSTDWVLGRPQQPWRQVATDFNRDDKSDLVWQNTTTGERLVWLMNGTTYSSGASLGTVGTDWSIAGTGDFNGDHKPDLVWQNTSTGERVIWLMDGASVLSSASLGVTSTDWTIAGIGDYDGDGDSDLAWQNTVTGECVVWTMSGTTHVGGVAVTTPSTDWSISGAYKRPNVSKEAILWTNNVTGERRCSYLNEPFQGGAGNGFSLVTVSVEWKITTTGDFTAA